MTLIVCYIAKNVSVAPGGLEGGSLRLPPLAGKLESQTGSEGSIQMEPMNRATKRWAHEGRYLSKFLVVWMVEHTHHGWVDTGFGHKIQMQRAFHGSKSWTQGEI